jgi:hypothetical protein
MPSPPTPHLRRGVETLRDILRDQTFDLRTLRDPDEFRRWLAPHLRRWQEDPGFQLRAKIRDLRRRHPELRSLERQHRRAALKDAATPTAAQLLRLDRELEGAKKAAENLAAALKRAKGARRERLRLKHAEFAARRKALAAQRRALVRSSPERQRLDDLASQLRRVRRALRIGTLESRLRALNTRRGRRHGRTGEAFERTAAAAFRTLIPELTPASAPGGVHLLRGVRLGAARVELDLVLVRERRRRPVEVLAVAEAKRNINDLPHGFRRRQEDLAWLTGDPPPADPSQFRSKHFPTGLFDRETAHEQDGRTFLFGPDSFRRFRRDRTTGLFLDRLYLMTRPRPLWGLSSGDLARLAFRIATDTAWSLRSDAYLAHLLAWSQKLATPTESPDLLRLYASTSRRASRLLILEV